MLLLFHLHVRTHTVICYRRIPRPPAHRAPALLLFTKPLHLAREPVLCALPRYTLIHRLRAAGGGLHAAACTHRRLRLPVLPVLRLGAAGGGAHPCARRGPGGGRRVPHAGAAPEGHLRAGGNRVWCGVGVVTWGWSEKSTLCTGKLPVGALAWSGPRLACQLVFRPGAGYYALLLPPLALFILGPCET